MSNCGQLFINTQCNYVDDYKCERKCNITKLKEKYNLELQNYYAEYNKYLNLKFGNHSTKQQQITADTIVKPQIVRINANLNKMLSDLKTNIKNTQTSIQIQEKNITSKNKDINVKNSQIKEQLEEIEKRREELDTKNRMIETSIQRNRYKSNVMYLLIIVSIILSIVIGFIMMKAQRTGIRV